MDDKPEGHRQRLREKFLKFGLDKFTDDEIIELLLTLATPRRDCKITARAALKEFGSFAGVMDASVEDLKKVPGIGPNNALGVGLVQSIARKFLRERIMREDYLNSFAEVLDYFNHALRGEKRESFHVLFLNSQNAILGEERISVGAPNHVILTPRQVMEKAFGYAATTLVLAHNHPGGSAEPSDEDVLLTREMYFTGRLLDVWVREHLIICPNGHYSFMREGIMARLEKDYERFHSRLMDATRKEYY
ncbi:MAG: DNA repair protein RadC [Nitrospinae bacterium]|nr:DNA repair protein RadC [Nitrospinota bacterium]